MSESRKGKKCLENLARLLIRLLDKFVESWCGVFGCRKRAKVIKVSYYQIHIIAVGLRVDFKREFDD